MQRILSLLYLQLQKIQDFKIVFIDHKFIALRIALLISEFMLKALFQCFHHKKTVTSYPQTTTFSVLPSDVIVEEIL